MTAAYAIYRGRDWIAFFPAALVLGMLVLLSVKKLVEVMKQEDPPMAISLWEEPPPEPPRVLEPPRPAPPELQKLAPPLERVQLPDTRPIEATAPPEPVKPPPPEKKAEPPPPPPATPSRTVARPEDIYGLQLKNYLESIKRYPTSREARLQRPTGSVVVWLELARDGTLKDQGIEKSSDSMILDAAARSTVRQGAYPPFPPDVYEGSATHRFKVTLEYKLDTGS